MARFKGSRSLHLSYFYFLHEKFFAAFALILVQQVLLRISFHIRGALIFGLRYDNSNYSICFRANICDSRKIEQNNLHKLFQSQSFSFDIEIKISSSIFYGDHFRHGIKKVTKTVRRPKKWAIFIGGRPQNSHQK